MCELDSNVMPSLQTGIRVINCIRDEFIFSCSDFNLVFMKSNHKFDNKNEILAKATRGDKNGWVYIHV